jgi:uncharacterized protein YajQ (UPF0234 family)
MPSFDIVSEVEMQEVRNAVDQVQREIATRYDFKGSNVTVSLEEEHIAVHADNEMRLQAVQNMLMEKLAKRKVSLKSVEFKDPVPAGGDTIKQQVLIKQGLGDDELKRVNKLIKGQKVKVNTQIQGNQLRVMGKKRDDLQAVIQFLRGEVKDIELQFANFRE